MIPNEIKLKKSTRELELSYNEEKFQLSFEFLRVLSPSAEVQGHGVPILQTHKEHIGINQIEPIGNYGIKIVFDDGHDTGIYTWDLLRKFCLEKQSLWSNYLSELKQAGIARNE